MSWVRHIQYFSLTKEVVWYYFLFVVKPRVGYKGTNQIDQKLKTPNMENTLVKIVQYIGSSQLATPYVPLKHLDAACEKKFNGALTTVTYRMFTQGKQLVGNPLEYKIPLRGWVHEQTKPYRDEILTKVDGVEKSVIDKKREEWDAMHAAMEAERLEIERRMEAERLEIERRMEAERLEIERIENAFEQRSKNSGNFFLALYERNLASNQPPPEAGIEASASQQEASLEAPVFQLPPVANIEAPQPSPVDSTKAPSPIPTLKAPPQVHRHLRSRDNKSGGTSILLEQLMAKPTKRKNDKQEPPLPVKKRKEPASQDKSDKNPPKHVKQNKPRIYKPLAEPAPEQDKPEYTEFKATYWKVFKDTVTTVWRDTVGTETRAILGITNSQFAQEISAKFVEPCSVFGRRRSENPPTIIPQLLEKLWEFMPYDQSPEDYVEDHHIKKEKNICVACGDRKTLSRLVLDISIDPDDDPEKYKLGSDCFYKYQSVVNWFAVLWDLAYVIDNENEPINDEELESWFHELAIHILYMKSVKKAVKKKYATGKRGDLNLKPPPRQLFADNEVEDDENSASGDAYKESESSSSSSSSSSVSSGLFHLK